MKFKVMLKFVTPLCAAVVLSACSGGGGGDSTPSYTVSATASAGGAIAPASVTVSQGATTAFTLTPDPGYAISEVTGCGGTLVGDTYTTGAVGANCTVSATFVVGYSVGGSVSGLNPGNNVVLQNNGGNDLTVPANGSFAFGLLVGDAGSYNVTVTTQPVAQACTVSAGAGTISGADVTNVAVSCITLPPVAPTVTLGYGIKELQFSWDAAPNATYYRLSENPDGASGYSVVADNITATSVNHEIALHRRINARYVVDACNIASCTASTEIFMANQLADAIGYFKASNTEAGDQFGVSLSLSADGNTLAVGANREDSSATGVDGNQLDNSAADSGAVYVFARSGTAWVQQAYLKASNTGASDYFGSAISLSADGNTLAVGASLDDSRATGVDGDQLDNSAGNSGAVYVFSRSGTAWTQQAYLKASNTGASDHFGYAVSLSGDGNTLAVGADLEDSNAIGVDGNQLDNSAADSGAVYVFSRSGTTWVQQTYIKASNTEAGDWFGRNLSLSGDGNTLAVGASGERSSATGVGGNQLDNTAVNSGAVYVFARSGTSWSQQAFLKASNTNAGDQFGVSLSLSADGNTLAVGANGEGSSATGVDGNQLDNTAVNSGAVYVFARSGTIWSQQAYLKASDTQGGDNFGYDVSLSGNGNTLAVGAYGEHSSATGVGGNQLDSSALYCGAAYLFTRGGTAWAQQAYLKAANAEALDRFGTALSLSGDGSTLAVGALREDSSATGIGGDQLDNSAIESGAVYLY